MVEQKKSPFEYSIQDLDKEIIARGAQVPDEEKFNFKDKEGTNGRDAVMAKTREVYKNSFLLNEGLAHIDTWDLAKVLIFKTLPFTDFTRGDGIVELTEGNEITDDQARKNIHCAAAICLKDNLTEGNKNSLKLKVKHYGNTFNLCANEIFREQPISSGPMAVGFPVTEDIIATAGHFIDEGNVTELRFIFGYKMEDSYTPVTEFSKDNIYSGIKIIRRVHHGVNDKGEWLLIKLDRPVAGWRVPILSKEEVYYDQIVYTLGYPLGLPLKYASGASVLENITETIFRLNLGTYSGYPGVPVFDMNTNEVIGMVLNEANSNFRWNGKGWFSVQNPDSPGVSCIKVSTMELSL